MDSHRVRGQIKRRTGVTRLVDILNGNDDPFLSLSQAKLWGLQEFGLKSVVYEVAYVSRAAVSLAIPYDDGAMRLRSFMRPFEYVERVQHETVVLLPLFQVRGMVHLPRGVDISHAPFLTRLNFVPMTGAEAVYLPRRDLVWRSEVIIVNMAKAQVFCGGSPSPASSF